MLDKNMKILVVDDFSTMRRITRDMLNRIGFRDIQEADDGIVAFEMLKAGEYDFVITDWNMPNMTGLELLQAIRADARLSAVPVLLVTAEVDKENVIQAAQAGVNDYVIKPFTIDLLEKKIKKIFL